MSKKESAILGSITGIISGSIGAWAITFLGLSPVFGVLIAGIIGVIIRFNIE